LSLEPLLNPQSIAIIGASETGLYPAGVLQNLLSFGYKGKIFPVNPRREIVQGLKSYPKITEIEESVDVAVLVVPRGFTMDVLEQCKEKGVKAVVIISAGFGEADEYGKELQRKLEKFAKETGIRILGPNCAGFANIHEKVTLTLLYDDPKLRPLLPGNVAFISQSGAMMMAMYGCFRDKEVGLSFIASTGNQADVEVSDLILYLVDDPRTKVIATFIEGVKDAKRFLEACDRALEKGKPIIVLKVGRTQTGASAAITHTGHLVGSDLVYDAIFKQKGVIRVDDVDELIYTAKVFSTYIDRLPKTEGIGIISQSGGLCSLSADWCGIMGLNLPELSGKTLEEMLNMPDLLSFGILRNPADVRGAGTAPETIERTVDPMLRDEKFGSLIIILGRPMTRGRDADVALAILRISKKADKPILVTWVGKTLPDHGSDIDNTAYRVLEKGSVPLFYNVHDCLKAMKHLISYAKFRERYMSLQGGVG